MLTYALLARISGVPTKAGAWAHEIAELVKTKTGVAVNVSTRLGGPQQIIWVSQYDDFAAFEKAQAKIAGDADYNKMVQDAVDRHLFDISSIETAFWLPV
jgi:hypothetical protein